jgi:hypothetical protein
VIGGSCQLSLSTDMKPTANSKWTVVQSWEGGCPSLDGTAYEDPKNPLSYPDNYTYAIPDAFAPGNYSMAWTWVPKHSGAYEFYMNCAPITLTAGKDMAMSSGSQKAKQEDMPDMLVVNIDGVTTCRAHRDRVLLYPNPGPNSIRNGSDGDGCSRDLFLYPTEGSGCPQPTEPYAWCGTSLGQLQPAKIHTPLPIHSEGVPIVSMSTAAPSKTATWTTSFGTGSSTISANPTFSTGDAGDSCEVDPVPSLSTSPAATPSGVLKGACQVEGQWNCIDGKSFQRCASGEWSVAQSLGAQRCSIGVGDTLRTVRAQR